MNAKASSRVLAHSLNEARVLVCAGTGGVGKTTISAALGLEAASRGRRTLVLTIDPARRLADALGVKELTSKPTRVDSSSGPLDAMMLDPKPTFDGLVTRYAKDAATRDRILNNAIYGHISEALAGSAEYAAMIQVHDQLASGNYDLIVVDTPPADHALDFLHAPRRMREFLGGGFVRTLARPALSAGRFGARLLGRGIERLFSLIERVAGGGFLEDVTEFLRAIDGLTLGLDEKSVEVERLLLGPESGFVLVCSSSTRSVASAQTFLAELDAFQVPLVAVVANRLRPWPLDDAPRPDSYDPRRPEIQRDLKILTDAIASECDPPETANSAEAILNHLRAYADFARAQANALEVLKEAIGPRPVDLIAVEELADDALGIEGLQAIGGMLAGMPETPPLPGSPRERGSESANTVSDSETARHG